MAASKGNRNRGKSIDDCLMEIEMMQNALDRVKDFDPVHAKWLRSQMSYLKTRVIKLGNVKRGLTANGDPQPEGYRFR